MREREFKYLLSSNPEDHLPLLAQLDNLLQQQNSFWRTLNLADYYFFQKTHPFIYRYRKHQTYQELTVKSLEQPEDRLEINLPLDPNNPPSLELVTIFIGTILPESRPQLVQKVSRCSSLPGIELSYYKAWTPENKTPIWCFEMEATSQDPRQAKQDLESLEQKLLPLLPPRCSRSLYKLLYDY